ncbi:MAG: hypothetical protein JWO66_1801 [Candidatus Eremiobacteraeota bacterium]|jgi:hypothetical protein|nr:hypothetical protein [Candidatus Eremiobacteraeota bacterium]
MAAWVRLAAACIALVVPAMPAPAAATTLDDVAVTSIKTLRKNLCSACRVHLFYASTFDGWGFTTWSAGESGGDMIMHQVRGTWRVIDYGHGHMDDVILVHYGVPPNVATALLSGSCPRRSRAPQSVRRNTTTVFARRVDAQGKHVDTAARCPR